MANNSNVSRQGDTKRLSAASLVKTYNKYVCYMKKRSLVGDILI